MLDSSAVLAYLWSEPGSDDLASLIPDGRISSVNVVEVVSKLIDHGLTGEAAKLLLAGLDLATVPFDRIQAQLAGTLRTETRRMGLSLGDRACLALALQEKARVVTADRAWADIDIGVEVELIR
ncbi:type II toxin-antitoxin system VapC family toxin [Jiella sp. M17.18]|uniref:type II toxin-antitoxin system VapC family toxin n=1 Tax=Jiella sp. M17.18 TaxID=3234247 RepID=UPI0034DF1981